MGVFVVFRYFSVFVVVVVLILVTSSGRLFEWTIPQICPTDFNRLAFHRLSLTRTMTNDDHDDEGARGI